ncbi:MAG: protein-glutamate O-methyltransferase CheR [Deltaproteobacteria bacterium]|nr:protein-glutamate O-methyltransferase CheR [Deltaproteobacteria bacterium]
MADVERARLLIGRLGGPDLSPYKDAVVLRRLLARSRVLGLPSIAAYLDRLERGDEEARAEVDLLERRLSVQVSSFFRNPEVFRHLEEDVLPVLLREAGTGGMVRVWCAACAHGQEAYSLAAALLRRVRLGRLGTAVSVLGSDVDAAAVATARGATYSQRSLTGLSPGVIEEMFEPAAGGRSVVREEIRRLVSFRRADLLDLSTYPERIDLVSCRNLLIYLRRDVQERVLVALAGALRPGGFLVLGQGETVLGRPWSLFDHVSPGHRIYRKPT